MVLIEINHHKTTEVKLNEEMMLAIMHAIGFADDQSITWYKLCLVPRRLSRCARKGRREGDCTLPMVPCGVSPVTRFALASAMRKTKRLRRRLVQTGKRD